MNGGGAAYVENKIDFKHLAQWNRSRNGQVIVCENTKATWMDFKPMILNKGTHKQTTEAIWLNNKSHFDNTQTTLQLLYPPDPMTSLNPHVNKLNSTGKGFRGLRGKIQLPLA